MGFSGRYIKVKAHNILWDKTDKNYSDSVPKEEVIDILLEDCDFRKDGKILRNRKRLLEETTYQIEAALSDNHNCCVAKIEWWEEV